MEFLSATYFGDYRTVLEFDSSDDVPECGPDDVRIRVVYAELNPVDLQKLRGGPREGQPVSEGDSGRGLSPLPLVVGYGGSGIVEEVGSNVVGRDFKPHHTRVAFLCDPRRPGSYATQVVVDSRLVTPIPFSVSLKQAATVPLAGCTAYESLVKLGLGQGGGSVAVLPPRDNSTLLIVGGSGGVGSWATQLARVLYPNLNIVTTASSEQSQQWCRQMGATQVIRHEDITLQLQGGPEGSVDYILCLAEPTPTLFAALADVIRPYGAICLVVAGDSIQSLDMRFVFFKAVTVTTETVFTSIRTNFARIQPLTEMQEILEHLATNAISAPLCPQLDSLAGAEDWQEALQEGGVLDVLSSGHTRGKMVMKVGSEE